MTKQSKSGIKAIIVGAGFGGLATAIECFRKGHDVEIFEQAPEFAMLGTITVFSSARVAVVTSNHGQAI